MQTERFEEGDIPGEVVTSDGYHAFNPDPLPPDLEMDNDLVIALVDAQQALSELAGIGRTVQNPRMLIRPFIRKEAVLSSRIEGTRADLSDVYAMEAGQEQFIEKPQRPEAREVLNYVRATEVGMERLQEERISIEMVKDLHEILLSGVRGEQKTPGEFRDRQNFIGPPGAGIDDARFVPPPPPIAHYAIQDLEEFLHEEQDLPALLEIGLIHYQFETIHPFVDGNGRLGRLLITLMMCERGLLSEPFLYVSAYFNRYRDEYINRLFEVSASGRWNEWLKFFLRAIEEQSKEAFIRSNELRELKEQYRLQYQDTQSETLLQVIYLLFSNPVVTVPQAVDEIGKTYPAVNNAFQQLEEEGVLVEITGKQRNRMFRAVEIFDVITQPLDEIQGMYSNDNRRQASLGEF